jgi:hypothetical protein
MRQAEIFRKGILAGVLTEDIFKPQTESYEQLPENEDLTMHLAEAAKIRVVPHSLIRLADGKLGYITKRIDRTKNGEKIDMEDMCQLTLPLLIRSTRRSWRLRFVGRRQNSV